MKKKYSLSLGFLLVLLLGNSLVYGQNQYYLDMDSHNAYIYYDDELVLSRMDNASDYTIEAWVFPVSGRVDNLDAIIHRTDFFSLVMYNASGTGDIKDFYFKVFDISIMDWNIYHTSTNETLEVDAWNHIAIINNSTENTLKFFVNGVNVTPGSSYLADNLPPAAANPSNLFIGADGLGTHSFGGYIDEVRLKNVAEDPSNLQGNMTSVEYLSDVNTAALFHFNEGVGLESVNAASGLNADLMNIIYWRGWRYKPGHSIPFGPRYIWRGLVSNSNFYEGNWDVGATPSGNDEVIVPSGTNFDLWIDEDDNFNCGSLTLESNAEMRIYGAGFVSCINFTIENNAELKLERYLTVLNTFTNNNPTSGLQILSYGNEIGSLIHNTIGVNAIVERHIDPYHPADPEDGWHYLSSPVGNYTIATSDFLPGVNDDLFAWDDATAMWLNYHGTGFASFEKGKGYLCSYQANTTHTFTNCAINVSDVSFNNIGSVTGWDLLGNPFTSAIDWNSGTWNKSNIFGAQVYSEDLRSWVVASIIPATQGFFVEVTTPINHITIPADARLHSAQSWYKDENISENTLQIKITGDQDKGWDFTTITFNNICSEAYDPEYDYHKLFGQPSAPQIFTLNSNQEEFCVNTQSTPNTERIIPLNIRIGYDGVYKIAIKENTIESEGNIYLEDLKTGIITNLSTNSSYSFQGIEGEDANRFKLHFNNATGINNIKNASGIHIYAHNHSIYLSSEKEISGELNIFNLGGQLVYSQNILKSNMHHISAQNLNGAYLVQFIANENINTQKVIIQ